MASYIGNKPKQKFSWSSLVIAIIIIVLLGYVVFSKQETNATGTNTERAIIPSQVQDSSQKPSCNFIDNKFAYLLTSSFYRDQIDGYDYEINDKIELSCVQGISEGQNINYQYCTGFYLSNNLTNNDGVIQKKVKLPFSLIFDYRTCIDNGQTPLRDKLKCNIVSLSC